MATKLADLARQPCDRFGGPGEPLAKRAGPGQVRVTGWRCWRCRHWPAGAYYVYVVELENGGLYVGQSALYPAERFSQHLTGYKAAAVVKRYGQRLRPDLFAERNPIPSREAAERMERHLAEELAAAGHRVYGGH